MAHNHPASAWYAGGGTPRYYIFTRRASDGKVIERYSTNVESACKGPHTYQQIWSSCATYSSESVVPNSGVTPSGVGAAQYSDNGTFKLMLVYPGSNNVLNYQVLSGTGSWSTPSAIGTATVTSPPSAVYDSAAGRIEVFANTSAGLKRWSFSIASASWDVQAQAQTWTTGGNIAPTAGVGVAFGYQSDGIKHLFLAVPYGSSANLDFARRGATANTWELITSPLFKTDSRPGLAYRPYENSDLSKGQFHILARDVTGVGTVPAMISTEGNSATCSGSKRLCAFRYSFFISEFDKADVSSMSLLYDPSYDTNMRGVHTNDGSILRAAPIADAILDFGFTDQNDYDLMKKNVSCGIGTGPCYECTAMASNGTCQTWIQL